MCANERETKKERKGRDKDTVLERMHVRGRESVCERDRETERKGGGARESER